MCRRNLLFGWLLIAGGIGFLVSLLFTSGALTLLLGLLLVVLGIILLKK